jgi:hypothetical protein
MTIGLPCLTSVLLVQRNNLQNCIYKYAEELPEVPEAAPSEEESLRMKLMTMIDEGEFGEENVRIDMFKAATVQNGSFTIKCK